MNENVQGTLRTWPLSGNWIVTLTRNKTSQLGCLLFTAKQSQAEDELYIWGLRHLAQTWSVVILDKNPAAVAGDNISVSVDGARVGVYPIIERLEKGGLSGIRASLPESESKRVIRLMALGDNLKFITQTATYSVQLYGIAHALVYMSTCDTEAESLGAGTPGPSQQ